jgi:hypothetical protein
LAVPFRAEERHHDRPQSLAKEDHRGAETDFGEVSVKTSASGATGLQFYLPKKSQAAECRGATNGN